MILQFYSVRRTHLITALLTFTMTIANSKASFLTQLSTIRDDADNHNVPVLGSTYDFCQADTDCNPPLTCKRLRKDATNLTNVGPCGTDHTSCFCFGDGFNKCSKSKDCPLRELCANNKQVGNFCLSIIIQNFLKKLYKHVDPPIRTDSPSYGTNVYPCQTDADCRGNRTCLVEVEIINESFECKPGSNQACTCRPKGNVPCKKHAECDPGEICAIGIKRKQNCWAADTVAAFSRTFPVKNGGSKPTASPKPSNKSPGPAPSTTADPKESKKPSTSTEPTKTPKASKKPSTSPSASADPTDPAAPSIEPPSISGTPRPSTSPASSETPAATPSVASPSPAEEEAVCIDANALKHLKSGDLVFKKHAWASVLCDSSGSCATRGHIVVYNGTSMMMKSYCLMVGCNQSLKYVNSPRYRRGVRIKSKSEGLEFTAFAARYETLAEETVLSAAIRIGL